MTDMSCDGSIAALGHFAFIIKSSRTLYRLVPNPAYIVKVVFPSVLRRSVSSFEINKLNFQHTEEKVVDSEPRDNFLFDMAFLVFFF